ncbi:MAG: hypothetical protein K1X28_08660 [Parachlamydiales bacterium]|nr:hypothetical protein [Parachlamydiales bacterium]
MKRFFVFWFLVVSFVPLMAGLINWGAPDIVSATMADVSDHRIVIDSSGNVTVIYIEAGVLKANTLPQGGSWGTPVTLSVMTASDPSLAVDSSGNVTAVWVDGGVVNTAIYTPMGGWGSATALSAIGTAATARVALSSNGDIVVVWQRSGFIESITKLVGGAWGLVSILSPANSDNPALSIGDDGTVVVVWHTNSVSGNLTMSASKQISGAWNAAKSMIAVSPAFYHNYPRVSVDKHGNAEAVWFRYQYDATTGDYIGVVLISASLPANAPSWSAIPTQLSNIGTRNPADLKAKIQHDSQGNVVAIWSISYDNSNFFIESALKTVGGQWTTPGTVIASSKYSYQGDLSVNGLNDAVIAYMDFDGSNVIIQSNEANVSGVLTTLFWPSPITVSAGSDNSYPRISSVYANSQVSAGASWINYSGGFKVLQVATGTRSTVSPPTNVAVQQSSINFGVFQDYYNTISWTASTDPNVIGYVIYRDGAVIVQLTADMTQFEDHNAIQNGAVVYGIAAVDFNETQSDIVTVSYP